MLNQTINRTAQIVYPHIKQFASNAGKAVLTGALSGIEIATSQIVEKSIYSRLGFFTDKKISTPKIEQKNDEQKQSNYLTPR